MERLKHVLLFSAGLCLLIQSISCQYVLIQERKSWDEAQAYCRQNHIDLATVQNNEDWTNVQRAVQPALTSAVWIGLYNNITSWRWSYQDEMITFVNWQPTEPNNYAGIQEYGALQIDKWNDREYYAVYPFFCYKDEVTGANRFVFITTLKTWREAQSYCRQHHTDLATIQSQSENDQLQWMMQGFSMAWIGLFRDWWKWSDDANVNKSSINWMTGQPNISGLSKPCGVIGPDGFIDDRVCSNSLPFICRIYLKKQILRLEVKFDKNANDPAVKESILQKVKQKLKDHGIESDTRLKWRLQPDGKVFTPKQDGEEDAEERNTN